MSSSTLPTASAKRFPDDFVWGVATIWDSFCRQPGVIADGSSGDVACEHYARWEQDLDMIRDLGVQAYRFSVSWPRVRPTGDGEWNEAGLAFYERARRKLQLTDSSELAPG